MNMYFIIVEVRIVPQVLGSIMELTICCSYGLYAIFVMISVLDHPWNWLMTALFQVIGLITLVFLPPAKP